MSDDVKAAAYRQVADRLDSATCNSVLSEYPGLLNDIRDLLRVFNAEHPADEDEPITFDELCNAFADSDVFASVRNGVIGASVDTYLTITTRGDVRKLALALRIELKEAS